MAHIDYFFSLLSPFTYFAGTRLEEMAEKADATITYKPLDVIALFARTGGMPPAQRHPNRQAYRLQELERASQKTGLPYHPKPAHFPTNAAPAAYALITAQHAGGGDLGKLAHGLLAACWAREEDIADDTVIQTCLKDSGFDPMLANSGLLQGAETYTANLEEAVEKGVFGSPFYVVDI